MKTAISFLSVLLFLVFFSSCQREVDEVLEKKTTDSTIHVVSTFKIVETDVASIPQDSVIRIVKTVMVSGEKSVIISTIYPPVLNDTLFAIFKYNSLGQLISLKENSSLQPSVFFSNITFTWNANRLARAVFDTMGVFEGSTDFSYTSSGVNTVITAINTPPDDFIGPNYFTKYKHRVIVNAQFLPIEEHWVSHSYIFQGGLPQNTHDTADYYYSYAGSDLSAESFFISRHDTSGVGGLVTMIERDTTLAQYTRSSSGRNIADSMRKIYGNDIYTLLNVNMINPYDIISNISSQYNKFTYFNMPLTNYSISKKVWINGIFDPSGSYANLQLSKIVNSFDSGQRLTRSDVYKITSTDLEKVIRIYY